MATNKRLARFNRIEVDTGPDGAPNWVIVKSLDNLSLTVEATEVDVTDFDSEGWDDSLTTHRKWSIACAGTSAHTGPHTAQVDDPGQAFLVTKGLMTGSEAYANVRFYRTDNNKGYTGRVTVNWGGAGAGPKDKEPFSANLTGAGKLDQYTHTP